MTTKLVRVGGYLLGDGSIRVQSMLKIPADDIEGNIKQAIELENAGCEIIRVAIPKLENISLIDKLKNAVSVPIVADIHFDYKIALEAAAAGVDKIRINPGNIGDDSNVKAVAVACASRGIPIRVGVNSGSVEKEILAKHGAPTAQALVESALYHIKLLEKHDFDDIVVSMKSSNVKTNVEAYRLLSEKRGYPLHLGVTEAGRGRMGIIKGAIGIGSLLLDQIGDTIRVSLTDNPLEEVAAAYDILKGIGLYSNGAEIISCPTCGRTQIDLIKLTNEVEKRLEGIEKNIKVAVMGCAVNGPGEAREADIGVAGGNGCGLIFRHGEVIKKVAENEIVEALIQEIEKI